MLATAVPSLLEQMRRVSVEDMLLPLLIQLALIIAVARLFAVAFRRVGQPAVVGEIAAGLVLGPSVLGRLFPDLFAAVFHPALAGLPTAATDLLLGRILTALAEVGLLLLLFLIGLEFDFGHLRWHGRSALGIALAGILAPFGLGMALGAWMHPLVAPEVPWLPFGLFMGTATSITAIPVLGRIMLDLGITRSRLATITISAAAVGDAVGWILLAAVAALARSYQGEEAAFDPWRTAGMVAGTLVFALVMVAGARPLLVRFARHSLEAGKGELSVNALSVTVVVLLLCAIATNLIGIFAAFGAFFLGAVLSSEHAFRDAVNRRLRDLVTSFFLPVIFAYTGLRTTVDALESWHLWALAAAVSGVAIAGKFGGCALAAWLGGLSRRDSACVGCMMNTRGLMELIVINLGKDLGIIPDSVFCMLVLMALLTTFLTTPLLLRLARGSELEGLIRESGFQGWPPLASKPGRGPA